jgi:hypothetical protein
MSVNEAAVATLVRMRRAGLTLQYCAAVAGIHVSTLCRWQNKDPELRAKLERAAEDARSRRAPRDEPRPKVRWRRDCPLCRAKVVVRSAGPRVRFWRCGRWPLCPWASWRPRAPRNCPACGGACFWSHSRKSTSCGTCGKRTRRR